MRRIIPLEKSSKICSLSEHYNNILINYIKDSVIKKWEDAAHQTSKTVK